MLNFANFISSAYFAKVAKLAILAILAVIAISAASVLSCSPCTCEWCGAAQPIHFQGMPDSPQLRHRERLLLLPAD